MKLYRFALQTLGCVLFCPTVFAAERPRLAGTWVLDGGQSSGTIPHYSSLSIGVNSRWFRSAELDKDARAERTVESECKIDNRFHPISGTEGGSIRCQWDGAALLSEKHWNNSQNRKVTRMTISSDGTMVEEIQFTGPEGNKASHLVWKRRE